MKTQSIQNIMAVVTAAFLSLLTTPIASAGPGQSAKASRQTQNAEMPEGINVPGRPGFVYSPYETRRGKIVDLEGAAPGVIVRCPYTQKLFRVPERESEAIVPPTIPLEPTDIPFAPPPPPQQQTLPDPQPAPVTNLGAGTGTSLSRITSMEVNLDTQRLTAKGPEGEWVCPISSGKKGSETPTGSFRIQDKEDSHLLNNALAQQGRKVYMPYWMPFNGGYALHGVRKDSPKTYPSSGGCIRIVNNEDAEYVFRRAPRGTPLNIEGSAATYLANNPVMPWQRPEVQILLEPDGAGGYQFVKTNLTPAMKQALQKAIVNHELQFLRPTKAMVAKDARWASDRIMSFPNIPELGVNFSQKSYAYWQQRLWSYSQLEAIGLTTGLQINR